MEKIYVYFGTEKAAQMLCEALAKALRGNGYHQEVETGSMVGPSVYEFVSNPDGEASRVISLKLDHRAGDPGEAEVSLETESSGPEVAQVVADGVFGLLAHHSRGLLESIDDAETRASIVDRLSEVLSDLK